MAYKNWLNTVPNWEGIKNLGSNSVVKTSYFWMILVPILAKLLNKVNEISINVLGAKIDFTLDLPFSWKAFYFAAVSFSIANILYQIFCPKLVLKYNDVSDFHKSKVTAFEMYKYCYQFVYNWKKNKLWHN